MAGHAVSSSEIQKLTSSNERGTDRERGMSRIWQDAEFPHETDTIRLIETHISDVVLTGRFAYKIKKTVQFDFVDYSTLERRKNFCDLELALNQRFAPEIYLGVVAIVASPTGIRFCELGESPPENQEIVDYAVLMREFSQNAIVASRLTHANLTTSSVEEFGRQLAELHSRIEAVDSSTSFGHPAQIAKDAADNFSTLLPPLADDPRAQTLQQLMHWTIDQSRRLGSSFVKRLEHGHVRRCHGDLHLKNVIQIDGKLTAFDGIEFNEHFQCVDTLSELAFPVMDFHARGRSDLGWRLLNAYLEKTGDYLSLDVLRFYLVYRAMVRAKVTWLNPANHHQHPEPNSAGQNARETPRFAGPWDKYIATAKYFAFELKPKLGITHGFSGSGKSTVAMQFIDRQGGIRLRSDVLRHKLAGKFATTDKYSSEMSEWVYANLAEIAKAGLTAGFPMIADATFLMLSRRDPFRKLAEEMKLPFEIINCEASFEELCDRIRQRRYDPSEADVDVLKAQMKNHDPLTPIERQLIRASQ